MAAPNRSANGFNSATRNSTLWDFGALDPTRYHVYFNDFDHYAAGDWTVTETGNGTQALTDIDGGGLLLTNAAGASDAMYLQKVGESFLMQTGKQAWFKGRIQASHATNADLVMGLQVLDTTPLDATDGIYFLKAAAGTSWSMVSRLNATTGSTTASAIATAVADTYITLGWHYDGKGNVKYFVDDVHKGTVEVGTTYLPDTELTISFGILGQSLTAIVDYVFAAKER
jgi:hypothetical protein